MCISCVLLKVLGLGNIISKTHLSKLIKEYRGNACLLFWSGDPHFKVAHAALDAVQACLQEQHCQLIEPSLDRLLPLLSVRITDPKEAIKSAAVGYV